MKTHSWSLASFLRYTRVAGGFAFLAWALCLLPSGAWAEATLVASPGRPPEAAQLSALLTSRGFGLSLLLPRGAPASHGTSVAEVEYSPLDARVEARGGLGWQLGAAGPWSFSAQAGGALLVPTRGLPDVGVGPMGGISVGLGGEAFEGFVGAQAGAEVFVRGLAFRVPLRALVGLRLRVGGLAASVVARGGADLEPGLFPTFRGEVALLVGWTLG